MIGYLGTGYNPRHTPNYASRTRVVRPNLLAIEVDDKLFLGFERTAKHPSQYVRIRTQYANTCGEGGEVWQEQTINETICYCSFLNGFAILFKHS